MKKIICVLMLLLFIGVSTAAADGTAAASALSGQDQKQFNILTSALDNFSLNGLIKGIEIILTRAGITLKNAVEQLIDTVFKMLCESLIKLWDFTKSSGSTGVGDAANYVNNTAMPILYTLEGALLYLFVVLKLFTGLLQNESPIKMVGYFIVVVFLVMTYSLFYSVVIEMFTRISEFIGTKTTTITTSTLARDFASVMVNNKDMIEKISSQSTTLTNDDILNFYKNGQGISLWLAIIVEILVSAMFVYFIVKILLLKGQQIVQIFLSYFLGILIIPITVLSGADLYVRWIKSFVGTCLYSICWALLIMVLYVVSTVNLGGLSQTTTVVLPSILKLMMFYGTFMLMTQVGRVTEFFTGGDTFGRIASASSQEFGAMLRSAGQVAAAPVALGAGAAIFGAGAGMAIKESIAGKGGEVVQDAVKAGFGGSGGGGRGKGGGRPGLFDIPGHLNTASGNLGNFVSSYFNAGSSLGSGSVNLASKTIAALRNSMQGNSTPNDGSAQPPINTFHG